MGKGQHATVPFDATLEELSGPPEGRDLSPDAQPRAPEGQVLPSPAKKYGGFAKGNKLAKLRAIQNRARGISCLSASSVPNFMKPDLAAGVAYAGQMLRLLEDRPVLLPMAGLVADSYTVARAFMREALKSWQSEGKDGLTLKERMALLAQAKGWLEMHDRHLNSLTRLRGAETLPPGGIDRLKGKLSGHVGTEGETPTEAPAIEAEGVAVEELSGMEELRRQIRDVSPAAVVPDPPPTCSTCRTPMVLRIWERPGGPPGNGWGCMVCHPITARVHAAEAPVVPDPPPTDPALPEKKP